MGHGKLKKFADNARFRCLLQPDAAAVLADKEPGSKALVLRDHPIKGNWGKEMFGNDHPIVLELGCGKGDYTIALALRHPEINYIGVDIKGARLWSGAKYATENALPNVAFLRTRIEFIGAFFGPSEVSEIWLTFSDPQLRGSENARLSSPMFLERYRGFLKPGGIIHLKTDSRYLYEYTQAVCKVNGLNVLASGTDVYHSGLRFSRPSGPRNDSTPPSVIPSERSESSVSHISTEEVTAVQTFYEKMFLEMGLPITYMAFTLDHEGQYVKPGEAFDHDYWLEQEGPRRSFSHQPTKKQ
jgi:tRNA (guanine-N7-)-methyltransferase